MVNIGDQLLQPESGWQRIDDSDSNIKYIGSWPTSNDSKFYNSTKHYSSVLNDSIKFSFYGTKLRLISDMHNNRNVNGIKLIIDDMEYSFTEYYSTIIYQRIVFEKTDLEEGIHNVKIINIVSGKYTVLDAIDIDEDGYMLPPAREIGDKLTAPDAGWQRIDDSDSNIKYIGSWTAYSGSECYNNGEHFTNNSTSSVIFNFYGSKLRILCYCGNNGNWGNCKIYIDNILLDDTINYAINPPSIKLLFEKLNLSKDNHIVKLEYNSGYYGLYRYR